MSDQEQIDNEDETIKLIRLATFGKQVEQFLVSDIGRYLMANADVEAEEALKEFKKCDPSNVEQVRSLQNTIQQSEKFKQWLITAVNNGLEAIHLIEDRGGL